MIDGLPPGSVRTEISTSSEPFAVQINTVHIIYHHNVAALFKEQCEISKGIIIISLEESKQRQMEHFKSVTLSTVC